MKDELHTPLSPLDRGEINIRELAWLTVFGLIGGTIFYYIQPIVANIFNYEYIGNIRFLF